MKGKEIFILKILAKPGHDKLKAKRRCPYEQVSGRENKNPAQLWQYVR